MIQPGFGGHQIRFEREYEDLPLVLIDKHQVLQILLNLFRNAEQAIKEGNASDGMIRVRIRRHGEDRVRVEVKDSGVGLSGENLTRIFAHGFTTRQNGHGFGLHAGALAAQQMGGSLVAESEGLGLGATFILDLPLYGRGRRSKGMQEANVDAR
jgi:signal transduction histidine kinase